MSSPLVAALEACIQSITVEFTALMSQEHAEFRPYLACQPGTPVNQWHELSHSKRWSSYFVWQNGQPVKDHLERCPETARALAAIGMADIGGLCPTAMFSVLAPQTHNPPHHGEANPCLLVQLPLIVTETCT